MRRDTRGRNRKRKMQSPEKECKTAIKILGKALGVLVILFVLVGIFYTVKNASQYKKEVESFKAKIEDNEELVEEEKKEVIEEEDTTFTLTAIGDVMCHNTQYWDAYNKETNTYDFSYVFEDISYYTKIGDIAVGSLETSFAGEERGYSNYPTFNSPDALAYALKDIGIDVLSTAGNHCLDMGYSGLSRTIDVLDDADIAHLGTYKTQEDQEKILFKYVKGIKIAFVNYTYGTNGIPVPNDKEFCVNLIDKELIKKQIDQAKEQEADMIIACMHWGTEYKTKANAEQEELADFLIQNGVDIILGNHPHVLEQMEKRTVTLEDGTTKEGFVIYALGNFICDQNAENTRNSIILNLKVTKHTDGAVTVDKAEYVPIYMYKDTSKSIKRMKLIDIEKTIAKYEYEGEGEVSTNLYNTLKTQLEKITSIVGPRF